MVKIYFMAFAEDKGNLDNFLRVDWAGKGGTSAGR